MKHREQLHESEAYEIVNPNYKKHRKNTKNMLIFTKQKI